jgi:hypothetical protein
MTMLTLRPSVRKRDGVAVIDLRGEIDAGADETAVLQHIQQKARGEK